MLVCWSDFEHFLNRIFVCFSIFFKQEPKRVWNINTITFLPCITEFGMKVGKTHILSYLHNFLKYRLSIYVVTLPLNKILTLDIAS